VSDSIRTIHVEPNSDLGRILDEADDVAIELEKDGVRYRLDRVRASDRPSVEQIERSIAGIRRAAGAWRDINAEELKASIRERRKTANRDSVRW